MYVLQLRTQFSVSSWMRGRLMMLLICVLCGAGLELVWTRHVDLVLGAARGGPGWTAAQYLRTVDQLLKSENNAVLKSDLIAALGKDGAGAVQAMVQAGLLGARPPSRACLHVYCTPAALQSRQPLLLLPESK